MNIKGQNKYQLHSPEKSKNHLDHRFRSSKNKVLVIIENDRRSASKNKLKRQKSKLQNPLIKTQMMNEKMIPLKKCEDLISLTKNYLNITSKLFKSVGYDEQNEYIWKNYNTQKKTLNEYIQSLEKQILQIKISGQMSQIQCLKKEIKNLKKTLQKEASYHCHNKAKLKILQKNHSDQLQSIKKFCKTRIQQNQYNRFNELLQNIKKSSEININLFQNQFDTQKVQDLIQEMNNLKNQRVILYKGDQSSRSNKMNNQQKTNLKIKDILKVRGAQNLSSLKPDSLIKKNKYLRTQIQQLLKFNIMNNNIQSNTARRMINSEGDQSQNKLVELEKQKNELQDILYRIFQELKSICLDNQLIQHEQQFHNINYNELINIFKIFISDCQNNQKLTQSFKYEFQDKEKQRRKLENDLKLKNKIITDMQKQDFILNKKLQDLDQEFQTLLRQKLDLEGDIQKLHKIHKIQKDQYFTKISEKEIQIQKLSYKYTTANQQTQTDQKQFNNQQIETLVFISQRQTNLQNQIKNSNSKIQQLLKQIELMRISITQKQQILKQLQNQMKNIKIQFDTHRQWYISEKQKSQDNRSKIINQYQQLQILSQVKKTEYQSKLCQNQCYIQQLQQTLIKFQNQFAIAKQTQISLQQKILTNKVDQQSLQKLIQSYKQKIQQNDKTILSLQQNIINKNLDYQHQRNEYDIQLKQKVIQFSDQLTNKNKQIFQLNELIQRLQKQIEELSIQLENEKQSTSDNILNINSKNIQIDRLINKISHMQSLIDNYEQKLRDQLENNQLKQKELKQKINQFTYRNQQMTKKNQELKQQNKNITQHLRALETSISEMVNQISQSKEILMPKQYLQFQEKMLNQIKHHEDRLVLVQKILFEISQKIEIKQSQLQKYKRLLNQQILLCKNLEQQNTKVNLIFKQRDQKILILQQENKSLNQFYQQWSHNTNLQQLRDENKQLKQTYEREFRANLMIINKQEQEIKMYQNIINSTTTQHSLSTSKQESENNNTVSHLDILNTHSLVQHKSSEDAIVQTQKTLYSNQIYTIAKNHNELKLLQKSLLGYTQSQSLFFKQGIEKFKNYVLKINQKISELLRIISKKFKCSNQLEYLQQAIKLCQQQQTDKKQLQYYEVIQRLMDQLLYNKVSITLQQQVKLLPSIDKEKVIGYRKKIAELQNQLVSKSDLSNQIQNLTKQISNYKNQLKVKQKKIYYLQNQLNEKENQIMEVKTKKTKEKNMLQSQRSLFLIDQDLGDIDRQNYSEAFNELLDQSGICNDQLYFVKSQLSKCMAQNTSIKQELKGTIKKNDEQLKCIIKKLRNILETIKPSFQQGYQFYAKINQLIKQIKLLTK